MGHSQAHAAGHALRNLLRPTDTLHFFTSPYRRTRETTEGILETLTSDDPHPSPFRRSGIKVYEEPRLREQDFGNFQPCSAEMERMWQERADYGHFFYRIPNGESAADAYDRISGFNESLWRQFGEDDFASVCVLVTHGLMSRIFLMKWYHFSVEYFEDLRNVNHCEFLIMRRQENGKYLLENNLRTWSELKRERALKEAREAQERDPNGEAKEDGEAKEHARPDGRGRAKSYTVAARRWGGCPNGCNHSNHYVKKREDLEVLREKDAAKADSEAITTTTTTISRWPQSSDDDEGDDEAPENGKPSLIRTTTTTTQHTGTSTPTNSSLLGIPRKHLHVGRDGGGTYSGHTSTAGSDTEVNSEDEQYQRPQRPIYKRLDSLNARIRVANAERIEAEEGEKAGIMRLGDMPPQEGRETEEDDLEEAEREDRSIRGSVY